MTKQNILRFAPAVAILMIGSAFAAPGKGGNCTDIPIRVTMYRQVSGTTLTSAIYDDEGGEYINKVGGVSALIKVCEPQFGINAVWATGNTKISRKFKFDFSKWLSGSPAAPSFAGQGPFLAPGIISVRSITYSHEKFTTHVGLSFTLNRTTHELRFFPTLVDAPDLHPPSDTTFDNWPYEESPATVYPQAFDCNTGGTTMPSWIVKGANPSSTTPNPMQVGTLLKQSSTAPLAPEGQYSMPFEFRIEALACFAY